MFARQLLRKQCTLHLRHVLIRNTAQQAPKHGMVKLGAPRFTPTRSKLPRTYPLVKSLFVGDFDPRFMTYPEEMVNERYEEFTAWIKEVEDCISRHADPNVSSTKESILSELRSLHVFHSVISPEYSGLGLTESETEKLLETVSSIPWLGTYLSRNYIMPVNIISKYGTEYQKKKYLPKIASGEIVPTMCIAEVQQGINLSDIKAEALYETDETYELNAEKTLIFNAEDTNLFVVFAHCRQDNTKRMDMGTLSVLLVERDFGGITHKEVGKPLWSHNTSISTVTFENTIVPKENIINNDENGHHALVDSISPGEQRTAAQAVCHLRKFISELTVHLLYKKHLDQYLNDMDNIKVMLGRMATTLYCMESLLYFTAHLVDRFDDQDVAIEKAITEVYCVNECTNIMFEGLKLIGSQSYLRNFPYIQEFEDALALVTINGYNLDTNAYIASFGLDFAGKFSKDEIKEIRNPFHHPYKHLVNVLGFNNRKKTVETPACHVHPSMKIGTDYLENSIALFHQCVKGLLSRHGQQIFENQTDIERLSQMAIGIYAIIAAMGRASRSYCIGLKNSEQERNMAVSASVMIDLKIQITAAEIIRGFVVNGDTYMKQVADTMYTDKRYCFEHPLQRIV